MCSSAGTPVLPQREIEQHAVLGRHARVLIGVEEESGGRLRGHLFFVGEALDELGVGILAQQVAQGAAVRVFGGERDDRIGQDEEIGAAALAVDGVGCRGVARVEVGTGGAG